MPPFSSTGLQWSKLRASSSLVSTSTTNQNCQTHQDSCEEGTTKAIPPQETYKIWHGSRDPQKVLQLQHREHTGCITAWYGNCSASDCKALQRVVHTAQYITGAKLPAIQDLYTRRCQRPQPPQSQTVLSTTAWQAVPECQVQDKKASQQFFSPSHKTPEQVIKWLPGLFALCPTHHPQTLFYATATLCSS